MRCRACNSKMSSSISDHSVLIPHPTLPNKTTTMRVEEDCCNSCVNKSKPNYNLEESEDITDLGLTLPEEMNYDY